MTVKHHMKDLYQRLKPLGFDEKFVRAVLLPDWWDDELAGIPANRALAEASIAKHLKIGFAQLCDPQATLSLPLTTSFRLKSATRGTNPEVIRPSIVIAQRMAALLARSVKNEVLDTGRFTAAEVRVQVLVHAPSVTLEGLLRFCWERGIVVAHLDQLPKGTGFRKFDGLALFAGDRPCILLAEKHDAPAWLAFHLARNRLFSAVDSIPTTSRGTDVSEALRAAAGLANPGRSSFDNLSDIMVAEAVPATVYLMSDGAFGDLGDFDVGKLKIEYVSIGEAKTNNLGIVSFAVQRNEDKASRLEAFARITNPGDEKIEFTASLELDGKLLDASTGSVDARQEAGLLFELTDTDEGQLKLTLDYEDALKVDNVAYAAIRPTKQISILLITPGNNSLETALQTPRVQQIASLQVESPAFLSDPAFEAATLDASIDLVIFDQCSPMQMPSTNTLFIGGVPPTTASGFDAPSSESKSNGWKFGQPQGPALILDVNRSNPITQYLEMGSVSIVEARTIDPGESGTVLMTSDIGPVFAISPRGPFQDAVLGFSIVQATSEGVGVNTDWGIKRSFPVFVYATVEYLGGGITESSAPSVQPGWPIGLVLSKRFKEFKVVAPDGQTTELVRGDESRYTFTKTEVPGIYQVFAEGIEKPVESFCVNLFSSRESDLAVADSIKMGFVSVPASGTTIQARKETWRWILLFALALLVIEWIVFNRRVFI